MTAAFLAQRTLVVAAVKANPVAVVTRPEMLARLHDPGSDCSFEELGFDSLARMELCIWLQTEAGAVISEDILTEHASVNRLAAYLADGSR